MNQYLVIFLLEDWNVIYEGHWVGWVEGDSKDAIKEAYKALVANGKDKDMLDIAMEQYLSGSEYNNTIVEIIG